MLGWYQTGELQKAFLADLQPRLENDERIRAAWLEGSLGRGDSDRYSDIDLHLLIDPAAVDSFRAEAEKWLAGVRPLVLFRLLFDGQMVNALTVNGLRLDIWIHDGESVARDPAKIAVLHAAPSRIVFKEQAVTAAAARGQMLDAQIREFWRCIALAPSVVGRDEMIVSTIGLGLIVRLLTDILIDGYDVPRDAGVKKLNEFLPDDTRHAIESALKSVELTRRSVAAANLRLAVIMQAHGPAIAARHGFLYPAELEGTVLRHVADEMSLLGIDHIGLMSSSGGSAPG